MKVDKWREGGITRRGNQKYAKIECCNMIENIWMD